VIALPSDGSGSALSRRLRELRRSGFQDAAITQRELGRVLSADKPISPPLISSWEKGNAVPLERWLNAYATFFATERSVEGEQYRLLRTSELTTEERVKRDSLAEELRSLRDEALQAEAGVSESVPAVSGPPGGPWHFTDGRPVVIVGRELPDDQRPDTRPEDPHRPYGEMYTFGSIDALFELFGHVRAANPRTDVTIRKDSDLEPDDLTKHLVVVGGVDWNALGDRLGRLSGVPVQQNSPGMPADAYFEVDEDGEKRRLRAELGQDGALLSDAGHFLRMPSPLNRKRTLTVCAGHYSLGTLGVVRALTDKWFRDRNADFLAQRFGGSDAYSIVMRILVLNGDEVVTPDWTVPSARLHEWPPEVS
jgi:hypothetical protein